MTHKPGLLRVIEQNELDKISRCVRLVDSNGVFAFAVDEKYGDRIAALWNMAERLRLTTEEIEGRKIDNALYKLEELELMIERVERAEAVKESLTSALLKISGFSAFWKGFRDNEGAWENVWNVATDALISLRTTEDSSVVDGPPEKQPEGMTKLDKALQNIKVVKRVLVENSCPSAFGLENHCSENQNCVWCWSREVEE